MRDFIFILFILALGSFAVYDWTHGRTVPFYIDSALLAFALVSWRPWKRRR